MQFALKEESPDRPGDGKGGSKGWREDTPAPPAEGGGGGKRGSRGHRRIPIPVFSPEERGLHHTANELPKFSVLRGFACSQRGSFLTRCPPPSPAPPSPEAEAAKGLWNIMDHFPIYQGLRDYAANPIKDHLLTLSFLSQNK